MPQIKYRCEVTITLDGEIDEETIGEPTNVITRGAMIVHAGLGELKMKHPTLEIEYSVDDFEVISE